MSTHPRLRSLSRLCSLLLVSVVVALAASGCTPQPFSLRDDDIARESAEVTAVVDGDTIDVATANGPARVRLIGIDTPEIGRDGQVGECYAEQARDFLDQLLYGQTVELVDDATQRDVDRYGRLLRYVLIDGQSAAQIAIRAGAGVEYTYDTAYADQHAHRDAEDAAAAEGVGLWSRCG